MLCLIFQVDLGILKDIVFIDKIVVLIGGWNLFRRGNFGEIFFRLTYKVYVEDEEEEGIKVYVVEILEDDVFDFDEVDFFYKQKLEVFMREIDKESFMDVFVVLFVSEEF